MTVPSKITGSRVLVTGATGFIGSHLTDALLKRDCQVHCLVRSTSNRQWLDTSRVRLYTGDLHHPETYRDCVKEVDYVFHCAGVIRAQNRRDYLHDNARACVPFYQTCADHGKHLQAIVHLSSLAAVGPTSPEQKVDEDTPCHPITYYGKSKFTGEEVALGFTDDLPIVILRPPVVYGERDINFLTYLKIIRWGIAVKIGNVDRTLSMIYVKDLVEAMVRAAETPDRNDNIFFVTDGQVYSWDDVARSAMRALQKKARNLTIPVFALGFSAMISEFLSKLKNTAPLLDRQRMMDLRQSSWTASADRFFKRYSFSPQYDLNQGLDQTCAWYKKNGWL